MRSIPQIYEITSAGGPLKRIFRQPDSEFAVLVWNSLDSIFHNLFFAIEKNFLINLFPSLISPKGWQLFWYMSDSSYVVGGKFSWTTKFSRELFQEQLKFHSLNNQWMICPGSLSSSSLCNKYRVSKNWVLTNGVFADWISLLLHTCPLWKSIVSRFILRIGGI